MSARHSFNLRAEEPRCFYCGCTEDHAPETCPSGPDRPHRPRRGDRGLAARAIALVTAEPGSTTDEIAAELSADRATVGSLLGKLVIHGRLTRTNHGKDGRAIYAYRLPSPTAGADAG